MDDDRLSELPDSLILSILSLLEMRDVVRTTLLSKRWKNRWTSVPCLRFCYSGLTFCGKGSKAVSSNFISGALAQWKGVKILEFTISFSCVSLSPSSSDIDLWLLFATEKQVEKLYFGFGINDGAYFLPQCLYSCSSITKLSLISCSLNIERNVQWNQLKSLEIGQTDVLSSDAMNQILVGAPRLEELVLWFFEFTENFNIRSTSLMILEISECNVKAEAELRIWAPNLLSLEISASVCGSCLLYAPSLTSATLSFRDYCGDFEEITREDMAPLEMFHQVFRSIRCVENVSLFVVEMKENDMPLQFPNAEFLKLDSYDCRTVDVLHMFPKLKTLIIDQDDYYMYNSVVASGMTSRTPSLPHLKTVEIYIYDKHFSISPLVKFLLENGHVLQKMVLETYGKDYDQEAFILALKELLEMRRSSPYAKLIINEVILE